MSIGICRSDKLLTIANFINTSSCTQAADDTQSGDLFCVCVPGELLVLRWTFVNTFEVPEGKLGD